MMKKALLFFTCLLCLSCFNYAQPGKITNPNAPEIAFDTEVIDYGNIEQGSDPFRIFKFRNTGKAPLIIHNAVGSCGCTIPDWPKEPIKPGGTGEIKVRYDTKRLGPINRSVTVTTNASESSSVLRIKGNVQIAKQKQENKAQGETNGGQSVVH